MDDASGSSNLQKILKTLDDVSVDLEQRLGDPRAVRLAVERAASTLIECYGHRALERAKLLEASAQEPMFAKMVTAEVQRLRKFG